MGGQWRMARTGGPIFAEASEDEEKLKSKQLIEIKKQSREDLFQFVSMIVQAEIALDLTHAVE
jgi:hypothetical protein